MYRQLLLLVLLFALSSGQALAAEETGNNASGTSPIARLQVVATTVIVYASMDTQSPPLYEIAKGNLLDVVEQQGRWFRIKVNSFGQSGWVLQAASDFGDMTVTIISNPKSEVQEAESKLPEAQGDVQFAQEQVGSTPPEQAPQTRQFQPAAPNRIMTLPPIDPAQVEPPQANLPRETVPIQDRWRLMQALGFRFPWYDPYNQNHLKGDLPVLKEYGKDLFFNLGMISDTLFEGRRLTTPVSQAVGIQPGVNDIYGKSTQFSFVQNFILSLSISKGNTTFKPPEFEFKFSPVFNINHNEVQEAGALYADPRKGTNRTDNFLGVQELFLDLHLRNVSDRYDFDSIRVGIQPFISDFRGFLFQDTPFGVRVFGNRDNNRYQYNLAWFRRLEKDTNSGLNDILQQWRQDDVFTANLYRQDFPVPGFTSQVSLTHNRNNETDREYDTNGFLVRPTLAFGDGRPHHYQVTYLGYTGDGHFGRWNLSSSSYLAIGQDSRHPIAQKRQDILAGFHASELSRDFDWVRVRGNFLIASGDKDPYDDKATGFDAILENPQFAGASTSYYIRQNIPLVGGGGVAISGRNGLLPSLRSSPIQGQSNFVNPGLILLGLGTDLDISPQFRLFGNISELYFVNTSVLGELRGEQAPPRHIGLDASIGFHWRPLFTQNIIINGSMGILKTGDGLKQLYGSQDNLYSGLLNVVLTY